MLTLAVLMQLAGLIFTFSLGMAGYVIGPLVIIAGGWLYRHEQRRRKAAALEPPPPAAPAPPRRPGWQRFLIGFACVGFVICATIALVWRLTAGLVATADEFFLALKAQDFAKAKTYLAEDFRAATSEQDLADFVSRTALNKYASANWSTRSIQNSIGTLEGNLETESGGLIPMNISMVKEKDGWKIYTLRKLDPGIQSLQSGPTPGVEEQTRLVRATTHAFADAVAHKDFTEFHSRAAKVWQRQVTPADLQKAMQGFIDTGADFHFLDEMQPVMEGASFDDDGALVIKGSYPTTPNVFAFRHRYIYEGIDWKLVGLNVSVR